MALESKTFAESHNFTRPITATYIDINGDEQTAAINEPRFEYEDGEPIGLKFGAQDSATCPLTTQWYNPNAGTYILRAQAPNDMLIAESGATQFLGVTSFKTYVARWDRDANPMSTEIALFPSADVTDDPAYISSHLFQPFFLNDENLDSMLFFNNIINGEWT